MYGEATLWRCGQRRHHESSVDAWYRPGGPERGHSVFGAVGGLLPAARGPQRLLTDASTARRAVSATDASDAADADGMLFGTDRADLRHRARLARPDGLCPGAGRCADYRATDGAAQRHAQQLRPSETTARRGGGPAALVRPAPAADGPGWSGLRVAGHILTLRLRPGSDPPSHTFPLTPPSFWAGVHRIDLLWKPGSKRRRAVPFEPSRFQG